jgi:hypothetical protein
MGTLAREQAFLEEVLNWSNGTVQAPGATAASRADPRQVNAIDYETVQRALQSIQVRPEMKRGYIREDWPHWIDANENCLDAREEVLIRDSLQPVVRSKNGCSIVSGVWFDPYTGQTIRDPRKLDVDHVVALQEAHDSGGHAWGRARRIAYANDLSDSRTLKAVSREANRAKSAYGPEDWLPPASSYRCHYVVDWVVIKARWQLSMDERERVTVGNILTACRNAANQ